MTVRYASVSFGNSATYRTQNKHLFINQTTIAPKGFQLYYFDKYILNIRFKVQFGLCR
ncbi:MAG: hypothetical protein ACT4ON_03690 [Bacteroidota bacterium]